MTNVSKKPASAYDHYKKLVRDFNALEDELQASSAQQQQLQTAFLRVKSVQSASEQRQRQREARKWENDRDRQLQAIVGHEDLVQRLHQQADELQAQELRLRAELELLHERQEAERMTEAVKLRQLIHDKASLLEKELTKGQVDLDFTAQLIDAVPASGLEDGGGEEGAKKQHSGAASSPVRALVQTVQERRRGEFEAANRRFQEQLAAFTHEQEALRHKMDEIRTRKQRALQILSSNQQEAIREFFTTSVVAVDGDSSDALSPETSEVIARHAATLDFAAILGRIDPRAPSRGLERLEIDKEAGRRRVEDALQQAQATVKSGVDRLVDVERKIARRQQEANSLDELLDTAALTKLQRQILISMPWTIDSCPPELLPAAYCARNLLFEWAASAVDDAERRRLDLDAIARSVLSDTLMREIVDETAAEELHEELRPVGTGTKVRNAVGSAFRSVFHRGKRAPQTSSISPKKPANTSK